jgi:two-component system LytT family response regulator
MPTTIFVTAYDTHALRAFDAQALDYLLKPIDDERFSIAVDRARQRLAERKGGAVAPEQESGDRLVVRDRGRVLVLSEREIDWVAAEGDYVRIYANGRGHLLRGTMSAMEARLAAPRFARIHRSTIVNVDRIREVRSQGDRDALVVLRDGSRLKLSRHYRANLSELSGVSSRPAVDSTTDG